MTQPLDIGACGVVKHWRLPRETIDRGDRFCVKSTGKLLAIFNQSARKANPSQHQKRMVPHQPQYLAQSASMSE